MHKQVAAAMLNAPNVCNMFQMVNRTGKMCNHSLWLLPNHLVRYKQEGRCAQVRYGPNAGYVLGNDGFPVMKDMHMHEELRRSETYGDADPQRLSGLHTALDYCKDYGFSALELQTVEGRPRRNTDPTTSSLWECSIPHAYTREDTLIHQKLLAFAMAGHPRLGGLDNQCIFSRLPPELMEMILREGWIFTTLQMLDFCRRYYNDVGQERTRHQIAARPAQQ
jgi:hypothetical protein